MVAATHMKFMRLKLDHLPICIEVKTKQRCKDVRNHLAKSKSLSTKGFVLSLPHKKSTQSCFLFSTRQGTPFIDSWGFTTCSIHLYTPIFHQQLVGILNIMGLYIVSITLTTNPWESSCFFTSCQPLRGTIQSHIPKSGHRKVEDPDVERWHRPPYVVYTKMLNGTGLFLPTKL